MYSHAFSIFASVGLFAIGTHCQSSTEPCASVSSALAAYAINYPDATAPLFLDAKLAYQCAQSAPIYQQDALDLVDGLTALLKWQSTLAYLKNPPSDYLLDGVDLLGGIQKIRDQVTSGAFTSEIDFQTSLQALYLSAGDGHLAIALDALGVFTYQRANLGDLVSISADGVSPPEVWVEADVAQFLAGTNIGWQPSAISTIDGVNVTQRLMNAALLNGGFQDPDALYNALFNSLAGGSGLFLDRLYIYTGPTTDVVYANGSSATYENVASTRKNFTGVNNGQDFYNTFCNVNNKKINSRSLTTTTTTTDLAEPAIKRRFAAAAAFPSPIVSSPDGNVAGYFLTNPGYESTAVLTILQEAESQSVDSQTAYTQFLEACRNNNMTYLVIDVQANPGGDVGLAYDFFKQLFPDLDPYVAGNVRAQPQYDVMGTIISPAAEQQLASDPNNINAYEESGGYTIFDIGPYLDEAGDAFVSWDALYGPRQVYGDQFTNVIRRNISDPNYTLALGGIVVSGYGNMSNVAPQPFLPENMILLTDGRCSSSCSTIAHLLKYQGKVKSITMGGRPETGPMQAVGGVKGNQVWDLFSLGKILGGVYTQASTSQIQAINATDLKTLVDLGLYMLQRSAPWGTSNPLNQAFTFNLFNSIAEGDSTTTPLQFVYEAADCRLWWQANDLFQAVPLWERVAANAFGLGGINVFAQCVDGSTGDPSSLSGDTNLFNGGTPANVTTFEPDQLPTITSGSSASASATGGGGGGGGGGSANAGVANQVNLMGSVFALGVAVLVAVVV